MICIQTRQKTQTSYHNTLVIFSQPRDIFVCDYLIAVKVCQGQLYTLYYDPSTCFQQYSLLNKYNLLQSKHDIMSLCWAPSSLDLNVDSQHPHLQHVVKAMYTAIYAKVRINGNNNGEIMSDIGVKQDYPLFPTLVGLQIVELETYLDEIDGDFLCLFSTVVVILLYVDNDVLLSIFGTCPQRL